MCVAKVARSFVTDLLVFIILSWLYYLFLGNLLVQIANSIVSFSFVCRCYYCCLLLDFQYTMLNV